MTEFPDIKNIIDVAAWRNGTRREGFEADLMAILEMPADGSALPNGSNTAQRVADAKTEIMATKRKAAERA